MKKQLTIIIMLCRLGITATGQDISFSNISTVNGLSDNFIRSLAVDKSGFLWIGTNEGLNRYDGYAVTHFTADDYPGIPSKTITHLMCDKSNRLWMGTAAGAGWADAARNFHRAILPGTRGDYHCSFIRETKSYGPVLITNKGHFSTTTNGKSWTKLDWIPSTLDYNSITDIDTYDEDRVLVSTRSGVLILDYGQRAVTWQYPCLNINSACHVSGTVLALATSTGELLLLDTRTGTFIKQYNLADLSGAPFRRSPWTEVRMAAGGNILYASNTLGFFIISKDGKITRYTHDPTNPWSVAADKVLRVLGTGNGNVVVGTERYGVSIFNIKKKQAGYQKLFTDGKGSFFDGYLTEITQDATGIFWMGAIDRLIRWDRASNTCRFYQYRNTHPDMGVPYAEVYRLCNDRRGQLWVSLLGSGVALFQKESGSFLPLPRDTFRFKSLVSDYVYDLFEAANGRIWVASNRGFYTINPETRRIETLEQDSVLGSICLNRTLGFAEDPRGRMWISVSGKGVYCYTPPDKTLKQYTTKDGLLDDNSLELFCSRAGDIYVAQFRGCNIIRSNGRIETYTKENGLRYDKIDAFVEDRFGFTWASNAKCLVRLNPLNRQAEIYDEHENLNNGGFKPCSAFCTAEGELLWGTQSGLNYFYPDQLVSTPEPLQLSIYKVLAGDSLLPTTTGTPHRIRYRSNNLQFHFVAINLSGSRNIRYQYRLEGYDDEWQEGTDILQARYSSLPPGPYVFRARASADRKNWVSAEQPFSFTIVAPLYRQAWFRVLGSLAVAAFVLTIFWRRNRQLQQKKEELETEQAINYFASSLYEHQTVDDILWDVARNCIGRLQFEDCVIYMLDPEKKELVQKAAYGPKSPRSFEISQPIAIPLGKGIVGHVAQTGVAEIIPDTQKDPRYIVDDAPRLSEISVPVVYSDRVLGVIDCEHSKKGFFTQKHLSILRTIASLCAHKIVRAETEEVKRKTETMLAATKQKMAEAEMQALRAQMNPHFIFNCLNSINRYIVKSDQATASLYLTRFAKLIRLILDNSQSKNVVLSNELEALRLYIEMESLRFDNKFTYEIQVDPSLGAGTIEVPPLIIQPYIENAIWHGLLHKASGGHLSIRVSLAGPGLLYCVIEDNGVGREKALALKSKTATSKKSLGMELTENRLLLLSKHAEVHAGVQIEDLKDEKQEPCGTRVILRIPFTD